MRNDRASVLALDRDLSRRVSPIIRSWWLLLVIYAVPMTELRGATASDMGFIQLSDDQSRVTVPSLKPELQATFFRKNPLWQDR
jgi:hypothetical protein